MKQSIAAVIISLVSIAANAECQIDVYADGNTLATFKRQGGWGGSHWTESKFNTICMKLKRAHARVQFDATSVVLGNQSIGWAAVRLMDADTSVGTSDFSNHSTQTNSFASQNKADELMAIAINDAVSTWSSLDDALVSLEKERKKVRSVLASNAS